MAKRGRSCWITFKNQTHFMGRNGLGKCSGVFIWLNDNGSTRRVMVEPITSKAVCGNCQIVLDVEALPQIIDELKWYHKITASRKIKERKLHQTTTRRKNG